MTEEKLIKVTQKWSEDAYVNNKKYEEKYKESIINNEKFWDKEGKKIKWIKEFTKIKDIKYGKNDVHIKWFYDGTLNATINCIDKHLETKKNDVAIIWEGDDPKNTQKITFQELHDNVCKAANGLKSIGIKKGDRVTIYLTMIP